MEPIFIERMGTETNPMPMLLGEESLLERKKRPSLLALTYRDDVNPEEIRNNSLKILNTDPLTERGIFWKDRWDYQKRYADIEKLKGDFNEAIKRVEDCKPSNFYLPWKRSFWKNPYSVVGEILVISGAIGSALTSNPSGDLVLGSFGIGLLGLAEKDRRKQKEKADSRLSSIEGCVDAFKNIRYNLERAKIEVYVPEEARDILEKVKEIQEKSENPYELKGIDFEKVDTNLLRVYEEVLRERGYF